MVDVKLEEIVESAAEAAQRVKADKVRQGRGVRGQCDLAPTLVIYRGDEQVVFAMSPGRDASLKAAQFAASGYDADAMVHIFDGWQVAGQGEEGILNPVTGRRWQQGEMHDVVENHGGLEKGWVSEGLHLMAVNRAGESVGLSFLYRVVKRHVEWAGERWLGSADEGKKAADEGKKWAVMTGLVPEALREAMVDVPSFRAVMDGLGHNYQSFGMRDEEGRARQDCMVTRMLSEQVPGCAVAIFCRPGGLREAVIREWLPEGKIMRPTKAGLR